jgi:hypothetical protein
MALGELVLLGNGRNELAMTDEVIAANAFAIEFASTFVKKEVVEALLGEVGSVDF